MNPEKVTSNSWDNIEEIKIFQEYIRIPSVHPDVDYEPCVAFLRKQATRLDLPITVHYPADPKKPVVIITWTGTNPELPSIIFNSHMDVVPVFEEYWTYPPFGAEIASNGRIYGRGTQDMKSSGCQYLSAIYHLKNSGVKLKRTIHVTFVPDEEIGGNDGMKAFVQTNEFRALRVGFSFDEAGALDQDFYPVFFAERSTWSVYFNCSGTQGHGSMLLKNTAGEKVRHIIDRFMDFREVEVKRLESNPNFIISNVTTVNLSVLKGGVQTNVVPPVLTVGFDIRLAIDVDHKAFEETINRWCEEAGGGIEIFYESKQPRVEATKIDESNPVWTAFKTAMTEDLKLKILPVVCPGQTDSCYLRSVGVQALGFSPLKNTPPLLHDNDEYVTVDTFLHGIEIFKKVIERVGNA